MDFDKLAREVLEPFRAEKEHGRPWDTWAARRVDLTPERADQLERAIVEALKEAYETGYNKGIDAWARSD